MMKRIFPVLSVLILLVGSACQSGGQGGQQMMGGTEAGNPPAAYRTVVGHVQRAGDANLSGLKLLDEECVASHVRAIDADKRVVQTSVQQDCTFQLPLPTQRFYSLELIFNNGKTITILFDAQNESGETAFFNVDPGESPLDLGRIELEPTPEDDGGRMGDGDNDGDDSGYTARAVPEEPTLREVGEGEVTAVMHESNSALKKALSPNAQAEAAPVDSDTLGVMHEAADGSEEATTHKAIVIKENTAKKVIKKMGEEEEEEEDNRFIIIPR